jgi:acyl transferase domain-containing protein/NADPH:quinone reductase-like Zn-dependent oxidoreductase/acyl carrier protein
MFKDAETRPWSQRADVVAHGESAIAIIGMACRFPGGADSPDAYWDLLIGGVDAIMDVPPDRWSLDRFFSSNRDVPTKAYVRRGGFVRQRIEQFDNAFFGVSPREAALLDPQQRLLLEVTWEALEDGGVVPRDIRGSNTGVYIGGFTMDNQIHLLNVLNRETITTHTAIGSTMGMLSNRLSFAFDLRGPSLTVDTACSSSLVSLHLACVALIRGECEMAISGGVNVMLRPEYTIAMCKGGFLAPDGRCKTFDARADGYARGEGAGIIVLKPLRAALRDGDPVRAVIAGTAVNQDGRTDGITAPNSAAQTALILEVHRRARIGPDAIQYVEAHGTGTQAGDTAETTSLGEGLATRRCGEEALWLGSVKTNIGHLEAAAGIAATIKTVLALEHRTIPPNLHFETPNPKIDFAKLRLRVPTRPEPWPEHAGAAGAAVNSFGYGGTNAHAVLFAAPAREARPTPALARPAVFPLSAASAPALTARAQQLVNLLAARPDLDLADLGYTLARRRTHHAHRAAMVATTRADLEQKLRQVVEGDANGLLAVARPRTARNGAKLAFVFTGMGSQYYGMGANLVEREPAARSIFDLCDQVWRPLAGWSLTKLFEERTGVPMTEPEHAQPANFVLQVMLCEVLRSYGVNAGGIVGHSVGEIGAAYISGALTLEDALCLTYHRCRLQQRLVGRGKMMAVGLSAEELAPYLATVEGRAAIAAVNSPMSATVSGDGDAIVLLNEVLTVERVFSRILKVAVAYHSHHMDSLASEFNRSLVRLEARVPTTPAYSSVTGAALQGAGQDVAYWWRNAREPVRFADAVAAMIADGFDTFVEIGPHPVLADDIGAGLRRAGVKGDVLGLQHREQLDADVLLGTVARLYACGVAIDWATQHPSGRLVSLPSYPWQRETLWSETEASRADRLGTRGHPLLAPRLGEPQPTWEGELSGEVHRYLPDHEVQHEAILPAAAFVEMALIAKRSKGEPIAIDALCFHRSLAIEQTPLVRMVVDSDGCGFNIYSRARDSSAIWAPNASGRLLAAPAPARAHPLDHAAVQLRCSMPVDIEGFYSAFAELGLQYGPGFKCLRAAWRGENEILGRIEVSPAHAEEVADYYLHPTMVDAALQTLLALRTEAAAARRMIFLPVEIGQVRFHHKVRGAAWCHALLMRQDESGVEGDLTLYDEQGEVSVELLGLRARAISVNAATKSWKDDLLYRVEWHIQKAKPNDAFLTRRWLVFCDSDGIGTSLVRAARASRVSCVTAHWGAEYKRRGEAAFEVARGSKQDMARLLQEVGSENLDAIVYLSGLDIAEAENDDVARSAIGVADVIDLAHLVNGLESLRGLETLTLCLATTRAQSVGADEPLEAPGQNALIGFGRVLALEKPQLSLKMIDLNSRQPLVASATLLGELLSFSDEAEVAFRNGARYLPRVARWEGPRHRTGFAAADTGYVLKPPTQGREEGLEFHEAERKAPAAGEIEIAVQYWALAAGDAEAKSDAVLLGEGAAAHVALDVHVAGVVQSVGAGVTDLRANDEVIVLASHQSAISHLTTSADCVIGRPQGLSLRQAITLVDWAAAFFLLFDVARLESGESVLIHRAETGIGQAALQLAKWKGARVFATADSVPKRDCLRGLGFTDVSDGSSLKFVDDVAAWTDGRGVDVVLSSARGDFREKALELVTAGGHYVDIGGRENDRAKLPATAFNRGLQYHAIDLARFGARELGHILDVALMPAARGCKSDNTSAVVVTQMPEALRILAKDEQIGRVLVDLRSQRVPISRWLPVRIVRPDASYMITGGFGGFGLATLKWLADKGARYIAVVSRGGAASEEAKEIVRQLEADGVRIFVARLDVSDAAKLRDAIRDVEREAPSLRGIIHSAGVTDDAVIDSFDSARVEAVMNPKALGAWNLHRALARRDLDFFVCYSSMTAMLGNVGQSGYAAANAFLDGLAEYRRSRGMAGISVNWGVIDDVGMVARDSRIAAHLSQLGVSGLGSARALELLEEALAENWRNFGAFDLDWSRWQRQFDGGGEARISNLLTAPAPRDDVAAAFRRKVITAPPQERFEIAYAEVAELVCRVLGIPVSRVDAQSNLAELGVDSLMAVEIAMTIEQRLGFRFRALFVVRGPTIAEMAKQLVDDILSSA